eukprot:1520228-Prymnesium_polylepis.2
MIISDHLRNHLRSGRTPQQLPEPAHAHLWYATQRLGPSPSRGLIFAVTPCNGFECPSVSRVLSVLKSSRITSSATRDTHYGER